MTLMADDFTSGEWLAEEVRSTSKPSEEPVAWISSRRYCLCNIYVN